MHWHILIDGRLVFGKNNNLIVYKTGNVVDDAHVHDVIKPYVFYRALKRQVCSMQSIIQC